MSFHNYYVHGLHMQSEVVCPELPPDTQAGSHPDVTIRLLSPVESVSESLENGYYEIRPGHFRLAITGVGEYLVEDGNRISIVPLTGASAEELRLFLLGSAMGALLYQRGLFPLHGSAIVSRWGAMIVVGAQGAGKSTLAAEFHRHGYRLLSDDVSAVKSTPEGFQVLPALSHFRLCADAYERIGTPLGAQFNVDKYVVPMKGGYSRDPAPLTAIHVLVEQESGEPRFEVLRGFERVQRLFENLYRPHYLVGQSTQSDLMRLAAKIAEKTMIVQVARRRDPEKIRGLVDFLESEWAAQFDASFAEEKD